MGGLSNSTGAFWGGQNGLSTFSNGVWMSRDWLPRSFKAGNIRKLSWVLCDLQMTLVGNPLFANSLFMFDF